MTELSEGLRAALAAVPDEWDRALSVDNESFVALLRAGLIESSSVCQRENGTDTVILRRTEAGRKALEKQP